MSGPEKKFVRGSVNVSIFCQPSQQWREHTHDEKGGVSEALQR